MNEQKSNDFLHGQTKARLDSIDLKMGEHNQSDIREFGNIHKELQGITKELQKLSIKVSSMRSFWAGAGAVIGAVFGVAATIFTSWFTKRF